jgi:hypothetical protein
LRKGGGGRLLADASQAEFRIFYTTEQNILINKTDSKQPKIHRKIYISLWILKIPRKNP